MTSKDAVVFAVGGIVVGAIVVAFFLLLGGKEPPPLHWAKGCTSDAQCRDPWACADCMHCQESLKVCVYSMKDLETCICVENEEKACVLPSGDSGKQICMKKEKEENTTYWGDCMKG